MSRITRRSTGAEKAWGKLGAIERGNRLVLRKNPIHQVDFRYAHAMRGLQNAIDGETRRDVSRAEVELMVDEAFRFAKMNWQKTHRRIMPASEWPQLRLQAVQEMTRLVSTGALRRNPEEPVGKYKGYSLFIDDNTTMNGAPCLDWRIVYRGKDVGSGMLKQESDGGERFYRVRSARIDHAHHGKRLYPSLVLPSVRKYAGMPIRSDTNRSTGAEKAWARVRGATLDSSKDEWRLNPRRVIPAVPVDAAKGMKVLKDFRPAVQTLDYTCGPACMRAVLHYFGRSLSEAYLAHRAKTTKAHGTTPTALCDTLAANGLRLLPTKRANLQWCLRQLRQSRPVLLLWNDWKGHWVVLIGYCAKRRMILLADPAAPQGLQVHHYRTFVANWRTRVAGQTYRHLAVACA